MSFQLLSKYEAVNKLEEIASNQSLLTIQVSEDICFGDGQGHYNWVNLGNIALKQGVEDLKTAIQLGAYEWYIPDKNELNNYIKKALPDTGSIKEKGLVDNIQEVFYQGFQDIVRRLLLLLPTFDPEAVCRMPLKRPTTIVPDTSSIHRGALDFVVRFLSPMARIKIPAVVYMEIENQMDNYLSGIRWNKENRSKDQVYTGALRKHLLSQGGQRALLRLELHSRAEMDRGNLGSDPIRGIIHRPGSDPEDKSLSLTGVVKSFADRLILETARLHRAQVRPDHPLILMTSDQGMARMAMSEGMDVFFFQSRRTPDPAGKILTGTLFHPFKSEFYTIPLTEVLWELAVSFGGARIIDPDRSSYLELWALGGPEELAWYPLHAKEDLIWGRYYPSQQISKRPMFDKAQDLEISKVKYASKGYRFTLSKMLDLIQNLSDKGSLTYNEIHNFLKVKTLKTSQRYIKFLQSGLLVRELDDNVESTSDIKRLWQAIKEIDIFSIHELLTNIPSYSSFYASVCESRRLDINSEEIPISKYNLSEYIAMGEMAGVILSVHREGIVVTDADPNISNFAGQAYECYNEISRKAGTEWVLTGEWLECLALRFAVHPIRSRILLNKSKNEGILDFYLEGSTPETRFQEHNMTILELIQGKPMLRKVFLYQGDFIKPGTAGVRIKIKVGKNNAT